METILGNPDYLARLCYIPSFNHRKLRYFGVTDTRCVIKNWQHRDTYYNISTSEVRTLMRSRSYLCTLDQVMHCVADKTDDEQFRARYDNAIATIGTCVIKNQEWRLGKCVSQIEHGEYAIIL